MSPGFEDRAPGVMMTEVRRTPGGVIFYQVLGIRVADSPLIPERERLLTQLAPLIRAYSRDDGTHRFPSPGASGFEIVGDNVPVLMKGMNAYWDSLAAWSRTASETPKTFTPPLSKSQRRGTGAAARPVCTTGRRRSVTSSRV